MFRHIWRTIIVFFSYPKSQIFAAALILNFAKHNCEFATANVGFAKTIVIIVEQIVICAQHYLWPATGNSCTKVFLLLSMVMLSFCWAIIICIKCTLTLLICVSWLCIASQELLLHFNHNFTIWCALETKNHSFCRPF